MGAVYQAKDVKRQTVCAIKEMSLSMVSPAEREQAIDNFKSEAKLLWALNHPNLPSFTGFFNEGQRYYMVMEFIDGSTLEDLLEHNGSPFSERRVLGWARQMCDVLEYLHSQHPPIIFRDMKPGNVMLTRNGRIKLIDFGIARFFRPAGSQDTQLLGTPGFAPPEQYGKAQTDERSDIYSLAITLFQLLTNTLPETGFGLKDVRAINPEISPAVARALERGAALDPEERYNSVADFRRALLGVGTFVFENGDQATTPEELAELCARYPEEASDYLADGEIESWLLEIGDTTLARAARHIRAIEDEPMVAVEQFLQVVMGPNARLRSYSAPQPAIQSNGTSLPGATPATGRGNRSWFSRKATSPILVSPRILDFGKVYPGISAPLVITISGDQGLMVNGTVHTNEPWILIDQTQFDGMMTRINVRLDSNQLQGATHYVGTILITPDGAQKDIEVIVEADTIGSMHTTSNGRRGKTVGADLNDDEDDDVDDLTMGMTTSVAPAKQVQIAADVLDEIGPPPASKARDSEYKIKYGAPASARQTAGWDPIQVSPRHQAWLSRTLTLLAAFMAASLVYTLVAHLPLTHAHPLAPDPWFIVVLAGIVPATTLGALLVNRGNPWHFDGAINRFCTGITGAFLALAAFGIPLHFLLAPRLAVLQLVILLLVTAIGATISTMDTISDYINYGISWAMSRMYWPTIIAVMVLGGGLGFLLAMGLAPWAVGVGIVTGLAVANALVWRVDYLMKQNARNAQSTP